MNNSSTYDVIVIGGGAAGIMAAIEAGKRDKKVMIVDRTTGLGRKILVCGAGRCNLTNINVSSDKFHGASKAFIEEILNQFSSDDVLKYFKNLGVEVYVENKGKGKVFPVTDQAVTINEVLRLELEKYKVEVLLETDVLEISKNDDIFILKTCRKELQAQKVILSAGGKTYPALGSNGSGYDLASKLGHTIILPVPSALPLLSIDPICKKLQGVKIRSKIKSIIEGKCVEEDTDDLLFTAFGLSGSAIFNISRSISIRINREKKFDTEVEIDFLPDIDREKLLDLLYERARKFNDRKLKNLLTGLLNEKVISVMLELLSLNEKQSLQEVNKKEIKTITDFLKSYKVQITGTKGWNEAEFSAGGVDSREVDRRSLESKIMKGLYFAGEILDVDGDVGGFNLTWAWSSGFVVGQHV